MRSLNFRENILLGKEYFSFYKQIYNFPFLTPEEISAYQLNKIKKLIYLAYNHTKFYKELYTKHGIYPEDIKTWSDFEKLPTVTKEDIVANHSKCIVDTKKDDKNLIISRSSGSSGQIIDVLFESASWIDQALIMLRMYQLAFNYQPFDKQALIYTSEYPYHSILGLYKAHYIRTLTSPTDILQMLQHLQPAFIVSYPSIILEIIAKFRKECEALKPKAISTNSDTWRNYSFLSIIDELPKLFSSNRVNDSMLRLLNFLEKEITSY